MKKVNKIFKYFIFPLLLLIFWAFSTFQYARSLSFSILEYKHSDNSIISGPSGRVLKGDKITGEFKANEDNLGILVVKFKDFTKYSYDAEDVLSFKLKEKNTKDWYFEGSFRSGLLEKNLNFPIGFPTILDSKNKTYYFEIVSLNGNEENGVVFDKNHSAVYTRYQFSANQIKSSKKESVNFIIKKIETSFKNPKFVLNSLLYLIPFLLYVFLLYAKRYKNANKIYSFVVLSLIFLDIIYFQEIQMAVVIGLLLGWIFVIKEYKISYRISFFVAFLGILTWAIMAPLSINYIQEKLNLWTYIFLLIGLVQIIIEEKRSIKKNK